MEYFNLFARIHTHSSQLNPNIMRMIDRNSPSMLPATRMNPMFILITTLSRGLIWVLLVFRSYVTEMNKISELLACFVVVSGYSLIFFYSGQDDSHLEGFPLFFAKFPLFVPCSHVDSPYPLPTPSSHAIFDTWWKPPMASGKSGHPNSDNRNASMYSSI